MHPNNTKQENKVVHLVASSNLTNFRHVMHHLFSNIYTKLYDDYNKEHQMKRKDNKASDYNVK